MSENYEINFVDPGKVLVFADSLFERQTKLKFIEKDVSLINRVFGNLNFTVETCTDLTSNELKNKISQLENSEFTGSCIICIFSTYGDLSFITTRDGKKVSLNEIVDQFSRMKNLLNKPKLFLIDGSYATSKMKKIPENLIDLESESKTDILIQYASISNLQPDTNNEGSKVIQKFCKSIGLNDYDIKDILSDINQDLTQIPTYWVRFVSSLRKKFFFQKNSSYLFKRVTHIQTKKQIICLEVINENLIASGDYERIKIWNIQNQKCIRTLRENSKTRIRCLKRINDELIASGQFDNSVKIWNWKNNTLNHVLLGHKEWIFTLELINDHFLASGSGDKTINIWNLESRKSIQTLNGHGDYVYCLKLISHDLLASGSGDKTIKIWNIQAKKCIQTLSGHFDRVLCLQKLNQEVLISGSVDRTIKIWNWQNNFCLKTLFGHVDNVFCLKLIDEETLASGSGDKTIKIWNLKHFKCIQTIFGHSDNVLNISLVDRTTLVSCANDENIFVWKSKSL